MYLARCKNSGAILFSQTRCKDFLNIVIRLTMNICKMPEDLQFQKCSNDLIEGRSTLLLSLYVYFWNLSSSMKVK